MEDQNINLNEIYKLILYENIQNKDGFYQTVNLFDTQPQTAANFGIFFIARHPCEVLRVSEVHGTIAAAAATVTVEKLTGTTAKGAGVALLATAFDLNGVAANTVQIREIATLVRTGGAVLLRTGDRLAIVPGGNVAGLKDLQITVYLKPSGKGDYR